MKNFTIKLGLGAIALGLACCSCRGISEPAEAEAKLSIKVNVPGWADTKAEGQTLCPINILLVQEGGDEVIKAVTSEAEEFSITVPVGAYDIYAVCGLPQSLLPARLSSKINVPEGTDFAIGSASVEVAGGMCSPSTVSITAERQMARLNLNVTGVPENISAFKMYLRGKCDSYSLTEGWTISEAGKKRFTPLELTKEGNSYSFSGITAPGDASSGITFVAEATTEGGYTSLLTYICASPLSSGTKLTLNLEYAAMSIAEGGISISQWQDITATGTLSTGFALQRGDQYFSQAATVVNVSSTGNGINILAHRPMRVTINDLLNWDFKHLQYDLSPEINVLRWAFPTSETSMRNVMNAIQTVGWDVIDAQFVSNGLAPIDHTATNILAFYDRASETYYRFDFASGTAQPVNDMTGEYLLYPLGIIQISE